MPEQEMCPGCDKPKPSFWCWEGRDLGCGVKMPPRWASEDTAAHRMWELAQSLDQRISALETR